MICSCRKQLCTIKVSWVVRLKVLKWWNERDQVRWLFSFFHRSFSLALSGSSYSKEWIIRAAKLMFETQDYIDLWHLHVEQLINVPKRKNAIAFFCCCQVSKLVLSSFHVSKCFLNFFIERKLRKILKRTQLESNWAKKLNFYTFSWIFPRVFRLQKSNKPRKKSKIF